MWKRKQARNIEAWSNEEAWKKEEESPNKRRQCNKEEHGTIAAISKASKHHPFRIRSILKGQKVIALVHSGHLIILWTQIWLQKGN